MGWTSESICTQEMYANACRSVSMGMNRVQVFDPCAALKNCRCQFLKTNLGHPAYDILLPYHTQVRGELDQYGWMRNTYQK